MSSDITVHSHSNQVDDRAWLIGTHGVDLTPSVTLDISKFNPDSVGVNQSWTVTLTNDTDGTFVLNYRGKPTSALDHEVSAADMKTAIVAIDDAIVAADVTVTGSAGGPYTVTAPLGTLTADGALLEGSDPTIEVEEVVGSAVAHYQNGFIPSGTPLGKITSTGLYGPYDDSVSDGREVCRGLLFSFARAINPTTGMPLAKVGGAMFVHGGVKESKLPFAVDANGKTDLSKIVWL